MKYVLVAILAMSVYAVAEDFEWNVGAGIDESPTTAGSWDGWGEWFVTTVENDTGQDIELTEFGFPCNHGDGSGPGANVEWVIWYDVGDWVAPTGGEGTADERGDFTPADTGSSSPPVIYTYVDVASEAYAFTDGAFLCYGYQNPGLGGQIDYNGWDTWAWYGGAWDPDQGWGRTALIQVKGNYASAIKSASIGEIKASFK